LAERAFPADEVAVLASSRSQGIEIEYGDTDKMLKIQNISDDAGYLRAYGRIRTAEVLRDLGYGDDELKALGA
jgi:hypothetical protein